MPVFTQESLEALRQRIDLIDVLSSHVDLKRAGSTYKGLCPFHDEKTPSFVVRQGDDHYHCYGCGAHGDAIQFLMTHLSMRFSEAVESLAERFHLHLETIESSEATKGPNKHDMKQALETACRFYHFYLLHTPEGRLAFQYLYQRGISLDFVRYFQLGLAPNVPGLFRQTMHAKKVSDEIMVAAGLSALSNSGGYRDFFVDRILFPIRQGSGAVVGFSARKYKEETFGGKYINTPETALFKKSHLLFGLNYSRKHIAKERRVIVVEGQIDVLRLIFAGITFAVAGQGTAFGEGHVKELMALGVNQAYLALDSDEAGREASYKIGDLLQREGVEVRIVPLPPGSDPDAFLREKGAQEFLHLLEKSLPYLPFLLNYYAKRFNQKTPAGKNELVQTIAKQIRQWNHPLMVHESLRQLAHLTQVPEHLIGVGNEYIPNLVLRKSTSIGFQEVDPNYILETDFLRWLILMGRQQPSFVDIARKNLQPDELRHAAIQAIYQKYLKCSCEGIPCDFFSLIEKEEEQELIHTILEKKINPQSAKDGFIETLQKILDRNWMEKREEVKEKIQSGQCRDEEVMDLLKQFDQLKCSRPKVDV
ncbi:MAG: DNA primase [Waddliaceae bacterium]